MRRAKTLLNLLTRRLDFADVRGGKLVLVPHCALNQNARAPGAAERPAAVLELIVGLLERDVGIFQMPCPELILFGLDRGKLRIEEELERPSARAVCRRLAREVVSQIQEYRARDLDVLGILGKNGSPSCGVEETWRKGVSPGRGAFFEELTAELAQRSVEIEMTGIRDGEPFKALEAVDGWLLRSSRR